MEPRLLGDSVFHWSHVRDSVVPLSLVIVRRFSPTLPCHDFCVSERVQYKTHGGGHCGLEYCLSFSFTDTPYS